MASAVSRMSSTSNSPFAEWAATAGIAGERPDGDFDNDGASNLMEFAFGGDPKKPDFELLSPKVFSKPAGATPTIQLRHFRRLDSSSAKLAYKVLTQSRLDTSGWSPAEILGTSTRVGEGVPVGYEEVTYELATVADVQFFRVQASTF